MKKKTIKIPKIDLSKYDDNDRLPSDVEAIILQGLIAFNCDCKLVCKHFNLSRDIVDKIYIKYYIQLSKIIVANSKNTDTDEAIESVVKLFTGHIREIEQSVDANYTKVLSKDLVKNLNQITDRLVTIKENNSKSYDQVVNKLIDNTIKLKALEMNEKGEVPDYTEYSENVSTISDLLKEYRTINTRCKKVKVTDIQTGKYDVYPSVQSVSKALGINNNSYISQLMGSSKKYKDRFTLEFTDDPVTIEE